MTVIEVKEEPVNEEDKDKPDFGLSGKLADDTNTFRGIVIKYNEPPEARKPKLKWRLYPFKGSEPVCSVHACIQISVDLIDSAMSYL